MSKLLKILVLIVMIFGCKNENSSEVSIIEIIEVIPNNGGGTIYYNLPTGDVLYVEASYVNSQGENVKRNSSSYNNYIEVDGFVGDSEVEVELRAVNSNDESSEPVLVRFVPLTSFVYLVQDSIEISPDLGGVKLTWNNPSNKTVYVYLNINNGSESETRILSSKSINPNIFVRGLQAISTDFSSRVEDVDGNTTGEKNLGTYTPLFEQKIEKNSWRLVSNLSIDGNAWEGRTTNFWDDIIDTAETNNDNSYFIIWRDRNSGTLQWPLDIVVDMNKKARINRFVVWQRAYWYGGQAGVPYYYQAENLKSFDLFVSNDALNWDLLGSFDLGNPAVDGVIPEQSLEEAANGHEFSLEEVTGEFRYFKFSITSNFGSDTYVHGSEISLYGIDNL